jgi:serine protease Do
MFQRVIFTALVPLTLLAQTAPPAPPAPPAGPVVIERFGMESSGSYLGVGVKEIDGDRAKALKLREEHGVEITNVQKESPADKAGLQVGDVVQKYQGQRVEGLEQFIRFVRETPPGRTVQLDVIREGSTQQLSAVMGKREVRAFRPMAPFTPPDVKVVLPDIPTPMMAWRSGVLGIEGESLSESQLASFFGVKEGVLVRSVAKGSAAEKAGIQAGDVITKVNEISVTTTRGITAALREAQSGGKDTFPVTITRDKRETALTVTMEAAQPTPMRRGRMVSQP